MKRIIPLLLLFLLLILTSTVSAQTELVFDTVQIQFWPEYDQPSMLVIYTLELSPSQPLPAEFMIRIPARAGEPTAVAVLEDNRLLTQAYTREVAGEWSEITVVTDSPVVHLEFYDPALSQADPERSFRYDWDFDYLINDLVISAKQPAASQDFTVTPNLGTGQAGQDGLIAYAQSVGSLSAGQSFSFEMRYTRSVNTLAAEPPSPFPNEPAQTEPALGSFGDLQPWVWALVGAGAVLVVVGVLYYIQVSRGSSSPSAYRQKKARSSASRASGRTTSFCHQCGEPVRAKDKFCRECGAKIRR